MLLIRTNTHLVAQNISIGESLLLVIGCVVPHWQEAYEDGVDGIRNGASGVMMYFLLT